MFHVLVTVLEALEPLADPACHRLDHSHAQPRKALEDTVVAHYSECDSRTLYDVHRDPHKTGIAVAEVLASGVMSVADQVQPKPRGIEKGLILIL
jgi:hypothetical protein